MIKAERYGGGHRWYCTNCDVQGFTITWTNSTPPPFCTRCGIEHQKEAAQSAIQYLKNRYQERAVFPGSIRAIADLCEKHNLVPVGVRKTHFARIINEVSS
jgi:hypothetical protein